MFVIRPGQMDELTARNTYQFQQRILAHLKQEHFEIVGAISDEKLQEIVCVACDLARKAQFQTEGEVARFVEVYVLSGAKLGIGPKDQGALRILRDPRHLSDWPNSRPCVLEAWRLTYESRS